MDKMKGYVEDPELQDENEPGCQEEMLSCSACVSGSQKT